MDKQYAEYLLKKTKQDYSLISEDFSRTRNSIWEELEFLFNVKKGEKVLDLGCGNGRYYKLFKNKQVEYVGVDSSKELIELAKKKYPQADFQVGDALNIPYPDKSFDKIYSIAVLHHIPSNELRLEFLKEAKRVLKPNGRLILTVWKFNKPFLILKYNILKLLGISKLDWGDIMEPWAKTTNRYYHIFSLRELKGLVNRSGLIIKEAGIARNKKGNRRNFYLIAKPS